jgi:capsular exopolysaccharide synthesis family protein
VIPHDAGHPDPSSHSTPPHPSREVNPVAGRVGEPPLPPRLPSSSLPPPPALSATPDILSLLVALRRRWISAVLLGGLLASLAAVGVWCLLTPPATAFARLKVAYADPVIFRDAQSAQNDFKTYLTSTAGQIKSRPVIWAALKRDEVKRLGLENTEADPVQAIEDDLDVEVKDNSELLTITYKNADPNVAKVVANAIKEAYLEEFVFRERDSRARRVSELEKALAEAVEQISNKKKSLQKLAQTLGAIDPALWREQRTEMVTSLRDFRQQQVTVQIKLADTRAQLDVFNARVKAMGRGSDPTTGRPDKFSEDEIQDAVEAALEQNSRAKRLRETLDSLEMEIEEYVRKEFRPDYLSLVKAREQASMVRGRLSKIRTSVTAQVRKAAARPLRGPGLTPMSPTQPGTSPEEIEVFRAQLQRQVKELAALDEKLGTDIAELSTKAARTPVQATAHDRLADEIRLDEEIAKQIGSKLEHERVELRAASRITKFQDAELMKKETKKQLLASMVAPIAVFFSVCGGLALLEHRQRKVRSAGEISRGLGIRVVGAVPRMPNLERHLVGPAGASDLEGTPVMESIDAIRTRLLHEADVRSTRVVLVTSATAGEGKTTLASALASSLARAGRKTLLLDGDLRRPTVHQLFEVPLQPGFSEVLLGEIEVAEAATESTQENLSLLPAGQWDREVLLALSRDGLEGIFEKLAEEFDFIVVDSHPVLSATDALLLGRQADAVVLSVLREVSQMPRVYAAHQQLTALGIRVLGAVVNASNPEEVFTSPAAAAAA